MLRNPTSVRAVATFNNVQLRRCTVELPDADHQNRQYMLRCLQITTNTNTTTHSLWKQGNSAYRIAWPIIYAGFATHARPVTSVPIKTLPTSMAPNERPCLCNSTNILTDQGEFQEAQSNHVCRRHKNNARWVSIAPCAKQAAGRASFASFPKTKPPANCPCTDYPTQYVSAFHMMQSGGVTAVSNAP